MTRADVTYHGFVGCVGAHSISPTLSERVSVYNHKQPC